MNYAAYTVEDFVNDPYFRKWVKDPDQACHGFWQNFILQQPEKARQIEDARELLLFLSFDVIQPSADDHQEVKKAIMVEIASGKKVQEHILPPAASKKNHDAFFRQSYYKMAAIFAGFVVCTALLLWVKTISQQHSFYTSYGETRTVQLPDGSSVMLNANSGIRFNRNWQETHLREVWLTGEAFFNVRKKPEWANAQFIVHTGKLQVKVLGTTFNVNNRRGTVKVMLNTGRITLKRLDSPEDTLTMQPKELVEFTTAKQVFEKKKVEPQEYISWRNHTLVFNDTPLNEIAKVLEDTYGVEVHLNGASLARRRFTGKVPNQHLDLFLKVLSQSMNVQIDKENKLITIYELN